MSRYSLIAQNMDTNEKRVIGVKEYDEKTHENGYKTKVNLATIDKYTLLFDNEEQLIGYLNSKGITSLNSMLYIEYQNNGIKKLPVLYNEYKELSHYANYGKSNVPTSDIELDKLVNRLLYNVSKDSEYFSFLVNNKCLNKYLEEHINDYLIKNQGIKLERNNALFLKQKIFSNMTGYKVIRGIVVGTKQYYEDLNPIMDTDKEDIEYSNLTEQQREFYNDMLEKFKIGGYEELNQCYDIDTLVNAPLYVQKRLNLKLHKTR